MVNHGFNHENVESIAKENSIKFDFAMLYYKYKGLEDYIYDFYENQFGSYGIDISGKIEYLINHETNLVLGDFDFYTNIRVVNTEIGKIL